MFWQFWLHPQGHKVQYEVDISVRIHLIIYFVCLDNELRKRANVGLVPGWQTQSKCTASSSFQLLGYFIHTLLIKCPITEQRLAVVWENQVSINILGYLLLNTTHKQIKPVQSGN